VKKPLQVPNRSQSTGTKEAPPVGLKRSGPASEETAAGAEPESKAPEPKKRTRRTKAEAAQRVKKPLQVRTGVKAPEPKKRTRRTKA